MNLQILPASIETDPNYAGFKSLPGMFYVLTGNFITAVNIPFQIYQVVE